MNKIQDLEFKIIKARNDYYNNQSNISDLLYDTWIEELSKLDPKNIAIIGIGSEPISQWEKYTHLVPMGSLNKCHTHDEFIHWKKKYANDDEILVTLKLDGLSVSLIYENGIFIKGVSRGSGKTGELLTSNVAKMIGVPLRLNKKINASIRGEILLSKENFIKYFSEYSNERNACSGISRRYDGAGSDKLNVMAYEIITDYEDCKTYDSQFKLLKKLEFDVPDFIVVKNEKDVLNFKNNYQSKLRDDFKFCLDGLVIHNNDLFKHQKFGSSNDRPYCSIAYKFDSIAKETSIRDIKIQVGNSGRITPVAIFEPKINLMGADVEKASLHNFSNIVDMGIGIGATVLVCRSGDVIPFVEEVTNKPKEIFQPPINCPECNVKLISVGEYIQCPNTKYCFAQISGRIKNWVKELNILELGESLIEKLINSGLVSDVSDLYTLTVEGLASLDRMGEKSAKNVYDSIWKNNPVPLELVIGGLSIPLIGSSTIKLLIEAGYDNLDKLLACSLKEMENVKGIGPARAESLFNGLIQYEDVLNDLISNGLKIKEKIVGVLSNSGVAFTGSMKMKRALLEQMVIDAGGNVKSSVGKSTTYLVIDDVNSTSSKAVNAKKFGTKLISEDDFLKLIGKQCH